MKGVWPKASFTRTESATPPLDQTLARLAAAQHGVVALRQLRVLGLSPSGARSRVAAGTLHRLHSGVYAVGHPVVTTEGRAMAAVLACGPGAALSHRSAAALWGLRASSSPLAEVSVPTRRGRSRPGIVVHSAETLTRADRAVLRGIPCTTVPRTLLDLAEVVDRRALERACAEAEHLRLFDRRGLETVLDRAVGRQGAAVLADVLADDGIFDTLTRSELEERFLSLCLTAGIPRPEVNAWVPLPDGQVQVDFLWRAERLIVEADGHRAHGTRRAFERDRRRDQCLTLAGWRVVRCTWRQIVSGPDHLADMVLTLLDRPPMAPG